MPYLYSLDQEGMPGQHGVFGGFNSSGMMSSGSNSVRAHVALSYYLCRTGLFILADTILYV